MRVQNIAGMILILILSTLLMACGGAGRAETGTDNPTNGSVQENEVQTSEEAESLAETQDNDKKQSGGKRVARDDAEMQTDDKTMPTRLPMEGGTKINIYFDDAVIPGVLNDSKTAKALIAKLPMTQQVSRYSHDFCGVTEELPYDADSVHYGWLNGDIDYATNAPYFTILFEDEDDSEQYGDQVNIGVITCPLEEISRLDGSYEIRIELAE